jgi:hypothetical protein
MHEFGKKLEEVLVMSRSANHDDDGEGRIERPYHEIGMVLGFRRLNSFQP